MLASETVSELMLCVSVAATVVETDSTVETEVTVGLKDSLVVVVEVRLVGEAGLGGKVVDEKSGGLVVMLGKGLPPGFCLACINGSESAPIALRARLPF